MIDYAAMTDEDLLTLYYAEEDDHKANEAFTELDRRYRPRLILSLTVPGYNRRFIKLHRTPGVGERSEELVADALFRVADSKGRPSARWDRSRKRVGAWILGILHNVVVSHLRRRRVEVRNETDFRQSSTFEDLSSGLDATPDDAAGPDEIVQHQALLAILRECVQELPAELRAVCELLYDQGLKQAEAATVLELSAPTLTRRKKEAHDLLRRCLARRGVNADLLN